MYLIKTKKHFEDQETKELQYKRAKCAERQTINFDLGRSSAAESGKHPSHLGVEELPDGVCFRPKNVLSTDKSSETAVKSAEYIGSFSVSGTDQNNKAEFVQKQLEGMRDVSKSKNVLLVISLSGIKVCSSDGESVYMAHALRRISFATCDPEFSQFSFIAREPKGNVNLLFCHAFITKSPEEAEEINAIVGNAFKMAYAQEKGKQPTFNELIEQQLKEQKVKFQQYQEEVQRAFQQKLKDIATPTPFSEKAQEHLEMRRQSSSDDSTISDKGRAAWQK
ncbi:hypothetical protein FSP39_020543 [Pinctada imbricata]|uniref:PID domain-containing protein n=1 Tax=Pinctada imbricata TaxID=66713 RepID=A0AA88YJ20_PINIB|nr:hypothetical protein FSP39_020543 [Pinctada imbricata]